MMGAQASAEQMSKIQSYLQLGKEEGAQVLIGGNDRYRAVCPSCFYSEFADPARGSVALQLMVLGVVFMLATLLVFGAIACFSGGFGALLQRSARAQTVLNRVAGLVFLGLAVRLATAER